VGLLLLSLIFCVGLALAAATAGMSALATRTHQLNPPTALWDAYPLRQVHSTTAERASKEPAGIRTGPTETRPTPARGRRIASRPTSGTGGFPTVFVMTGVIGALLASTLLMVAHGVPARAGGYRRTRGPIKTKPQSHARRTGRPSSARSKASRPKSPQAPPDPPEHQPAARLSAAAPAAPRTAPVPPRESPSVEHPDEGETTGDLLDALRPRIEPAEDPVQVSGPESGLRPVKLVEAEQHRSHALRQAQPRRLEVAQEQFCEIKLWRGYVKCQFYVEVAGWQGGFFESSLFRLRDPTVPDDRARQALSDLLADLERAGWSVAETGPVWYQHRLQRSTSTP
jgi:hypothetical protein